MSTINHQKLRELAFALQRMATPQKLLAFRAMLSPSAVLALLDQLEHARTTAPAIRLTLHHEIADFCATLGAPGEPETPEAMQQELLQRIDNVFDFFLNQQETRTCTHKKTACHASIGQVTFPLHLIKRVPGFSTRYRAKRITAQAVFLCVLYCHVFFASELWRGVRGRLRSGRILCSPVLRTLYVSPPRDSQLWMVSYFYHRAKRPHHGRPQTAPRYRGASSHPD